MTRNKLIIIVLFLSFSPAYAETIEPVAAQGGVPAHPLFDWPPETTFFVGTDGVFADGFEESLK